MSEQLYYIQHVGYVGDSLLWWREHGHGYTSTLDEAWKVPKDKAKSICKDRPKQDIMWSVAEIDALAVRHVNSEHLRGDQRRKAAGLCE